jgi:hypothetical protein
MPASLARNNGYILMDIDLARHVLRIAFSASRELGTLVPLLKEHCEAAEDEPYAKAIASTIAAIQLSLVNKVAADHPLLEAEMEGNIATYGQYL